jgi:hypothetical protein
MILSPHTKLLVAALLFGSSTVALAKSTLPIPMGRDGVQDRKVVPRETAKQNGATYILAAVDFCYVGSEVDPTTGETVDLYVPCPEDGFEQNIDIG